MNTAQAENLFSPSSDSNYITLYSIASPYGVDWSNPRSVLFSQLKNNLTYHARKLGHINVHLQCQGQEEQLTGMTSQTMDSKKRLILYGAGFGILWHSFDGSLETSKESLKHELPEYVKEDRLSFFRAKISNSTCAKLSRYLKEYREMNVEKAYGLVNRPRHKEGAGCTAFAASFLDVAKMAAETTPWQVDLLVPDKLLGIPINDRYVPLWDVLFTNRWANEDEPHKKIRFWDPDLFQQWILKTREEIAGQTTNSVYKKIELSDAPGIFVDYSHIEADNSPIWLTDESK